ncbi:DUF6662 family protein [Solimonas soli]|uniref:DUF6662 family protein n=1 Tax=Solimonas soli TaxID=413479 RepID=UPI000A06FBB6|nr:DUF6662 family protein [Solimonas soli]
MSGVAQADEPIFGYIYTTDLLPQGKTEIEQWATEREGRSQGSFHLLQTRTELSYGLSDNLQISGYANLAWASVNHNTPSGETAPPEVFADYDADPDARFRQFRVESFSFEALYRFLSPYTDPVGAALYLEPSIGPRTRELEARLILQKNFLDDRLIFAFNTTLGYEWRYLQGDPSADPASDDFRDHWDKETDVNFGLAGSYRFVSNWSAGLELQNEREWADLNPFKSENRTNSAWYFGPTLHYANEHFFATGTILKQLPWAQDYANSGADSFTVHGITNADDFENYRFRLKLGYYF